MLADEIQMEEEAPHAPYCARRLLGRTSRPDQPMAMIEDSDIPRQEVDIYSIGGAGSAVIGSIIVDVRGFALLIKAIN